jgi:hypothetical protein
MVFIIRALGFLPCAPVEPEAEPEGPPTPRLRMTGAWLRGAIL